LLVVGSTAFNSVYHYIYLNKSIEQGAFPELCELCNPFQNLCNALTSIFKDFCKVKMFHEFKHHNNNHMYNPEKSSKKKDTDLWISTRLGTSQNDMYTRKILLEEKRNLTILIDSFQPPFTSKKDDSSFVSGTAIEMDGGYLAL
jgi:hypothetical protein